MTSTFTQGAGACYTVMSALADMPLLIETWQPGEEFTLQQCGTRPARITDGEWCVALVPTVDAICVRAQLAYLGNGQWEVAELRPGTGEFAAIIALPYPPDPDLITAPAYLGSVRAAVLEASAAVRACRAGQSGWARVRPITDGSQLAAADA